MKSKLINASWNHRRLNLDWWRVLDKGLWSAEEIWTWINGEISRDPVQYALWWISQNFSCWFIDDCLERNGEEIWVRILMKNEEENMRNIQIVFRFLWVWFGVAIGSKRGVKDKFLEPSYIYNIWLNSITKRQKDTASTVEERKYRYFKDEIRIKLIILIDIGSKID